MKRYISIFVVFAIILGFAGCGTVDISSSFSSESVESYYTRSAISESEIVSYPPPEEGFLNEELLGLIGDKNSKLKELYSGECYAVGSRRGLLHLEYRGFGIGFCLRPIESGNSWLPKASEVTSHLGEGSIYKFNPYVDELFIMQFYLTSEYDVTGNTVKSQSNLRQFFLAEENITYAFLEEKLYQSPRLEHEPNVAYDDKKDYGPSDGYSTTLVVGGTYDAVYSVKNIEMTVSFIKNENLFIALSVTVGTIDKDL